MQFMPLLFPEGASNARFLLAFLILFGIFTWALFVVTKTAGSILGVDVQTLNSQDQEALPFLVMGYSPIGNPQTDYADAKEKRDALVEELVALESNILASNTADFLAACERNGREPVPFNSWQQNLRSAWFHRKNLQCIYVLNPSVDQFDLLKSYLSKAFENQQTQPQILKISQTTLTDSTASAFQLIDQSGRSIAPNYENYDYVYYGLNQALLQIRQNRVNLDDYNSAGTNFNKLSVPAHRDARFDELTCIDITAGQKIFSIAGAVLTLNRPLKFSYVNTTGILRFFNTNLRLATQ